jgi:DNA-binding protein H-NS
MQKKTDNANAIKIGIASAGLAALAAGAYFFFGPKGKKHRDHAKAWAIKMKGEVVEKLETAKEITEPVYLAIIDAVANEFKKSKKASQEEIDEMANDLKKHWKSISKQAISTKKDLVKDGSSVIKTAKKQINKKSVK